MARGKGRTRRPTNRAQVVVTAPDGDVAGAMFNKMVGNMRANESAIPVLVKSSFGLSIQTTPAGNTISFAQIAATDDFVSLAAQFQTFKVKAMRFEVFHINPSASTPTAVSTFHTDGGSFSSLTTEQSVVDGEDSKYLEPGSKKQDFYWNARGSLETGFQGVNAYADFGGLRYYIPAGTSNLDVARIVLTAQVVFRGRT